MMLDTSAGRPSDICAKIEPVRLGGFRQRVDTFRSGIHDFTVLFCSQITNPRNVPVGHDHRMAAIVRKEIQDNIAMFASPNHEILVVPIFSRNSTEETLLGLLLFLLERINIRRAPR